MSEKSAPEYQEAPSSEQCDLEKEEQKRQASIRLQTLAKIFFMLGNLCEKKASTIPLSDPPPSEEQGPSGFDDAISEVQSPD